ncbi:MAG TPA: Ser-Thr-rich GPI-anchored membrane family protein, partial [Acidobacteriota bacterium]
INTSQLQVTSPNGGESWTRNSTRAITWNAGTFTGKVKLSLYNKAAKIGEIATGISATTGTYSWKVGVTSTGTAAAGTTYSIRIEDLNRSQSDYSDATFAITN